MGIVFRGFFILFIWSSTSLLTSCGKAGVPIAAVGAVKGKEAIDKSNERSEKESEEEAQILKISNRLASSPMICDLSLKEEGIEASVYLHFHKEPRSTTGTQNYSMKLITTNFDFQLNFFGSWELVTPERIQSKTYVFNDSNFASVEGIELSDVQPMIDELTTDFILDFSSEDTDTLDIGYLGDDRIIFIDSEKTEWLCQGAEKSEIKDIFGFSSL